MSDSGEKTDILRFEPETQLVFDSIVVSFGLVADC